MKLRIRRWGIALGMLLLIALGYSLGSPRSQTPVYALPLNAPGTSPATDSFVGVIPEGGTAILQDGPHQLLLITPEGIVTRVDLRE